MRQRNIGWRLDYVLASTPLAKRAVSCPSYREIGTSDHAPVVATFELMFLFPASKAATDGPKTKKPA
jgi:exodeoxyribonuclease-3